MSLEEYLPLRVFTPAGWAQMVLEKPLELLSDHAHLEKKAAANALALLQRWPEGKAPEKWVKELSEVARDEAQHLALVLRIIEQRNGSLSKMHRNQYMGDLRKHMRSGQGDKELLDKLLISALIEARSCERFHLLAEASGEAELRKLYKGLWSSEKGHFQSFIGLAKEFLPESEVDQRWDWFLDREAEVIQSQPAEIRIHAWVN